MSKPIDHSKKSNIKCEHCKHWSQSSTYAKSRCGNRNSENCGKAKKYYQRCKDFEWNEAQESIMTEVTSVRRKLHGDRMKTITIEVPDDTEWLIVSAEFTKAKTRTYWLDVKTYGTFACHHGLGIHPVVDYIDDEETE